MAIEETDLGITPVAGGEQGGEGGEWHKLRKGGTGEKVGCQKGMLGFRGVWWKVSVGGGGHGCGVITKEEDAFFPVSSQEKA